MSAGVFSVGFYRSDDLEIHNIKYQPESAIFSIDGSPNVLPGGPATTREWVKKSKGATEYGLRPRALLFKFTPGQEPDDYAPNETYAVTVFDPAIWATASAGMPANYLGGPGKITGRRAENRYPA